jgi:polyhydroxyalkanoate synthase subunit PhaC
MPDPFGTLSDTFAKVRSSQFAFVDMLRRVEGAALGRLGFSPQECAWRVASSGSFWRLREYDQPRVGPCLLIVPAPIKRPYIWDLTPEVSVIRRCQRHGFRVFLIEWMPTAADTSSLGLKEYADAISACVGKVGSEAEGAKPFLIGHSLGGVLAAIYSALEESRIGGLVLLGAPLCFEPASSRFRDALVSMVPKGINISHMVPGSLLGQMSALASPESFVWARLRDKALSIVDSHAWSTNLRIERWSLDEVPLPGRLVEETVNLLYRENRFVRGTLSINGRSIGPKCVKVPTLAVVNASDEVAPSCSVAPFLDAMPTKATRIVEYKAEVGVGLQHLAMLIGREAHGQIWPDIFDWLASLH